MSQVPPIAIVGIAGLFPTPPDSAPKTNAEELDRFWSVIRDGQSMAREAPEGRWLLDPDDAYDPEIGAPDKVYSRRACFIDQLPDSAELEGLDIDPELLDQLDPMFHLALHVGQRAFDDAKTENLDRSRVGVILGNLALPTEKSSALARESFGRVIEEKVLVERASSLQPPDEETHPLNRCVNGLPAGLVARALGLGGGSCTLDAACASSLYAIKLAADELLTGRADAMLAGGFSRPDSLYTQMGFSQLRALSPSGVCSPFDSRGDGLVVGEGAGMFVLKRVEDAVRDGDHIHALVAGAGLSNDIGGSLLAPISDGQLRAMRPAYEQAGWSPSDVDLIECHATSTPVGDAVEFESLNSLWRNDTSSRKKSCVLGSVKSNVGHLLTGAGAAALMKVLLALKEKKLPPTANFSSPPAAIPLDNSPFRVLTKCEEWRRRDDDTPRRAAVSAFGFGGINAHLLIEEWTGQYELPEVEKQAGSPHHKQAGSRRHKQAGSRRHKQAGSRRHKQAGSLHHNEEPIAIVGMGATFGPWRGLRAFQERALGGDDKDTPPLAPSGWKGLETSEWLKNKGLDSNSFHGYYIRDLAVPFKKFRIPPREIEEMLPQQTLMMQVAAEAMENANLDNLDPLKTGVFIGLGLDPNTTNFTVRWDLLNRARIWAKQLGLNLSADELEQWTLELREAYGPALSANRTMGALGGVIASRIAREFHVGGPSFTISCEETSGVRALETAMLALRDGSLNAALVGAVDFSGDPRSVLGAHAAHAFSPSGRARPFDANADGCVVGEGAAAVVLKRQEDAVRDGDRIYALIRDIGLAGGGNPTSNAGVDAQVCEKALERAFGPHNKTNASVGYIEANAGGYRDEDAIETRVLNDFFDAPSLMGSVKADIGNAGCAAGLASLVKTALTLYQEILPFPRPQHWLRNRADGPRRAAVVSIGLDGNTACVALEGAENIAKSSIRTDLLQPLGARASALFSVTANTANALSVGLSRLRAHSEHYPAAGMECLARMWWRENRDASIKPLALALVSRSRAELLEQIALAQQALVDAPEKRLGDHSASDSSPNAAPAARDRVFYSPHPIGPKAEVAFVYPGSGNHFSDMGRGLATQWPEIFRLQDARNERLRDQLQPDVFWTREPGEDINDDHRAMIFGQVALGTVVSDLIQSFGVRPSAVIGYSLGETAGLFSLKAWTDRDLMLRRTNESTLFTTDLAGRCDAARRAWKLPESKAVDWALGVIDRPAKVVRAALQDHKKVYRLIVNTLHECVIGGDRKAVERLVKKLECEFFPLQGVTTVHCEVAREVEEPYRNLHLFETTPPPDVRFYSGAWGTSYRVTRESAADSVLAQALYGIDYPKVINTAYDDGVRLFLEMGPGASCSRMIGEILNDRPHVARSACVAGRDAVSMVLRVLAQLIAERIPVDLSALYGLETSATGHHLEDRRRAGGFLKIPIGADPPEIPLPESHVEETAPPLPSAAPPALPVAAQTPPVVAKKIKGVPEEEAGWKPAPQQAGWKPAPQQAGWKPAPQSLSPPLASSLGTLVQRIGTAEQAKLNAHEAFLRFNNSVSQTITDNLAFQIKLLEQGLASGGDLSVIATAPPMFTPRPQAKQREIAYDRDACMEFAIGSIGKMLGPKFAEIDAHPTRVRLPAEPLMLVDRIVLVEGEAGFLSDFSRPCSEAHGRVVTEHDVRPGAWYLDGGRMATCVTVEAGQADLFLSGYLGIDFRTKGLAVYRLLDAAVTFHGELPRAGDTIRYDIRIERFFRQGETHLFRFEYDATVGGKPMLTMRNGCAGFFTNEELDGGQGIVLTEEDRRGTPGKRPADWEELAPMAVESYSDAQVEALRRGDLAGCFGPLFQNLGLRNPMGIPGGEQTAGAGGGTLKLVDRVLHLDPNGGRFGLGLIRAEADIHPDDWFLTCHFIDDNVMPGTLMYECCFHTLRIFLLRMGWVGEADQIAYEPLPGIASKLICRGQVLASTRKVTYEVMVKELGYDDATQTPYALADVLMYSDDRMIVDIRDMSVRLTGLRRDRLRELWTNRSGKNKPLYDFDRILSFSAGKPSQAFGDRYLPFDSERKIARLPRPPYQFLDRVMEVRGEPWKMVRGTMVRSEYDVPPDAWYFAADRSAHMPFAVLLEIALQPCGWLAAYMGSALTNDADVKFRNLGGTAVQTSPVPTDVGGLTVLVRTTQVAVTGGMIIQQYEYEVHRLDRFQLVRPLDTWFEGDPVSAPSASPESLIYKGHTQFGFFSKAALANQVGVRDAKPYEPTPDEIARAEAFDFPPAAPFPAKESILAPSCLYLEKSTIQPVLPDDLSANLRMIDRVELFVPDGGPHGLGFIRGTKPVDPEDWFFQAHFYEDPVIPGSLGLEAFQQLLKLAAHRRWGDSQEKGQFESVALGENQTWVYRGQVIPACEMVTVDMVVTAFDDDRRLARADGFLKVDGRIIYQMNDFTVRYLPV